MLSGRLAGNCRPPFALVGPKWRPTFSVVPAKAGIQFLIVGMTTVGWGGANGNITR